MERNPTFLKRYGSAVVLLLLATLAFSIAAYAACENILVSGAGYAPTNGTYAHAGVDYGKPTYILGGAYRITWMGSWYLLDFVGGTYYQNNSSAAEPPFDGWVSLHPADAPAPTLSCGDLPPAPEQPKPEPEPRVISLSYELRDENLTLVYENVGNASATVYQLYAGPALCAQSADGATSFWIPDSDLWQVILLDQTYIVAPGETLTLVLPLIQLPESWLATAIARSLLFTDFTFGEPHIAVGMSGSPASWIHLVPAWLEQMQAPAG
ncbi:MAG: hypothetical protein NTX23_05850 [Candidatus Bipolaricaulota bacterium]|nr:hypothetical protein [Candidatus Bipolaricaulota bacterium]